MLELRRRPDGRRQRKMRRARTQTEAKRLLAEMRQEYDVNGSVASKNRSVSETAADYLGIRVALGRSKATLDRDRRFCETISVYFSARQTSELSVQDCDQLLLDLSEAKTNSSAKPMSRDEISRIKSFLSSALNNDMRLGHINKNVADVAAMPAATHTPTERRSLTNAEWGQLYNAAKGTTKLVIDLGGRHGLRPQEIRSIQWSNIDLVEQTLSVVTQFDSENEFVSPKTKRSTRTIRLHDETIALLAQRKAAIVRDRAKYASIWVDRDLVVCTRRGTAINKDNQRRSLQSLCKRQNIEPITPYELRHTAITHQIEAGHTASRVADWAGTSEKMIYKHYRHLLKEVVELAPVNHNKRL